MDVEGPGSGCAWLYTSEMNMKRRFPALLAMLAVGALFATAVKAANTTTITAIPTDVPDEMQPPSPRVMRRPARWVPIPG